MKTMQKLVSILVVLALVFTLGLGAFADENTAHTITVTNNDAQETHEYSAYQVFAGDYDEATGALSDVSWGSGVNGTALLQDLVDNIPDFAACTTAAEVVQVLATYGDGSDELRAFAEVVDRHVTTPADVATADAENPAVLNVEGDGYYYVKDTTQELTLDTYSDYILLVEGDVEIEAKDTTGVVSYKKVKDINDSNLEGTDWQDSADYDIGDPVPFQLNGTVANDYDKYETYTLIFHDVECEGLTFDHITGVFVDGVEITEGYTLVTDPTDECTFEVVFENLKEIEAVHGGSLITVEYESILNEDAIIGEPGNPNVMYMEYSNNPTDATSTGKTPEDKVVVFTYEVIIDKYDENGNLLPGADFELYKWYLNEDVDPETFTPEMVGDPAYGEWVLVPGEVNGEISTDGNGKIVKINGKLASEYTDPNTGEVYMHWRDRLDETQPEKDIYAKVSWFNNLTPEMIAMNPRVPTYSLINGALVADPTSGGGYGYFLDSVERETTAGTTFTWTGVDDGWYKLVETQTPSGYNSLDDLIFEITAEHSVESQDPVLIDVNGDPFIPTEENMGILYNKVINHSGGVLPSTGGRGYIWGYVLGALLLVGAGVVLVVKKLTDAN